MNNNKLKGIQDQLRNTVTSNLEQAIDDLLSLSNRKSEKYSEVYLLKGRYNDWDKKKNRGTGNEQNLDTGINKIREALLKIINSISEKTSSSAFSRFF